MRELLNRIVEALAADTAAVVLHEPDGAMRRSTRRPARASAAAPVRRASAARRATPRPTDGIRLGSLLGGAVASTLEAPLVVDGETIGALHVGTLFARALHATTTAALLRLAADRAAVGIQRARLYQREHRIAEELQRSLLPADAARSVPGLRRRRRATSPAGAGSQVGGDWYDALSSPTAGCC